MNTSRSVLHQSIHDSQTTSPQTTSIQTISSTTNHAPPLRIAMAGKLTAFAAPGGGEIQLQKTHESLRVTEVNARFWRPWEDDWSEIDCLHLFGSEPDHLSLIQHAHQRNIPVVLSTIAWFDWKSYFREGKSAWQQCWNASKFLLRQTFPMLPTWRKELYQTADLLLPNSKAEANQLQQLFQIPKSKIRVIPNGADLRFATPKKQPETLSLPEQPFVLYCGRIEPRKNQLTFLQAMQGTKIPIVMVGDVVPGHESYFHQCKQIASEHVTFIKRVDHESADLEALYANCGCLALTSWFETPGLVALEAAMSGVPLVLTNEGCTQEYFGSDAEYVSSNRTDQIRSAVMNAITKPRNEQLAKRVQQQFSWSKVAVATKAAYHDALSQHVREG